MGVDRETSGFVGVESPLFDKLIRTHLALNW